MAKSRARHKPPGKTQAERDAIALGRIESYMDQLSEGHINCPSCKKDYEIKELPATAVALIRARYDKLRPSLSAVEQTNVEAARSQDDIINDIKALLMAKPELLATMLPGYTIIPCPIIAPQTSDETVTH